MKPKVQVNIDTVEFIFQGERNDFILPNTTRCMVVDANGEVLHTYQNRLSVPSQWNVHPLQVRSFDDGARLKIEGSPFGHLTGQNLITSSDMSTAAEVTLLKVVNAFNLKLNETHMARYGSGDIILERTDLAVNWIMDSEDQCLRTLRQIRRQLEEQRGTTRTSETSVYWAPNNGKEYSICFYAKGPQMRRQKHFDNLPYQEQLLEACEPILRVEVRLRALALRKLKLNKVSDWNGGSALRAFKKYFTRLNLLSVTSGPVTKEELGQLPSRRLRIAYALHKSGVDLSQVYSPGAMQRHLTDFKKLKFDLKCPNQSIEETMPLMKFLSPKRAMKRPPKWMVAMGLICPLASI